MPIASGVRPDRHSRSRFTGRCVGSASRRIVFGVLGALLFFLQLLSGALAPDSPIEAWAWTVASCGALALAGWLPKAGGALFALIVAAGVFAPIDVVDLSQLFLGVYAVVAYWISRRWYLPAAGVFLVVEGVQIFHSPSRQADVLGLLLGGTFAVVAGLGAGWYGRRVNALEDRGRQAKRAVEEARRIVRGAEASVRHSLAATLHDTVATDLVRVVIASQSIVERTREPDTALEAEAVGSMAREAMWHLRALMDDAGLAHPGPEEPLAATLATCRAMLSGRGIALEADVPDGIEGSCTPGQCSVLALALREGCTNILKYAPAGSTANVVAEALPQGGVALSLANDADPAAAVGDAPLSGGFGLISLAERAAREGGSARHGSAAGAWLLTVTLPGLPTPVPDARMVEPEPAHGGADPA